MAKNIIIKVADKNVSKVMDMHLTNGAYPKWGILDIQVETLEEEE